MITPDQIRALSGLSSAELPDATITASFVLDRVELDRTKVFPTLVDIKDAITDEEKAEAYKQHDYRIWKAIVYLENYIRTAIPKTISDNFNTFTRFDTVEKMLEHARTFVNSTEAPGVISSIFTVVSPTTDPVTS